MTAASGASSAFAGFRFPREVISVAVRWHLRYGLSYRDVEELLAERGITVDHVTIYRWVQRFTPEFAEAARPCRHAPGDRWSVNCWRAWSASVAFPRPGTSTPPEPERQARIHDTVQAAARGLPPWLPAR